MAAPGRAAAEAPGVDLSAQNDFSLWVHTDFNYTTPPFASLTEGLNGSELAGLQNDFQASLQQAYGYKNMSKLESFQAVNAEPPAPAARTPTSDVAADDSDDDGLASEEKRRRNSAASARFRLKKKLKEQKLEQAAKAMTERAEHMQRRVRVLEAEVSYLRELIILRKDRDREAELTAAADNMRAANEMLAANNLLHH